MVLKERKPPKVQRGISLHPALYEAIKADADKLGKGWNEVAESVLAKAYSTGSNLHKQAVNCPNDEDESLEIPE